ncbi:MAG: hypothetical protein ACKVP7_09140 [Hyphomicrobiaceae bacterium]
MRKSGVGLLVMLSLAACREPASPTPFPELSGRWYSPWLAKHGAKPCEQSYVEFHQDSIRFYGVDSNRGPARLRVFSITRKGADIAIANELSGTAYIRVRDGAMWLTDAQFETKIVMPEITSRGRKVDTTEMADNARRARYASVEKSFDMKRCA